MVIFRKIVIIFLGRNTPNNKFVDVRNTETNKVTWQRCGGPSIMNLGQLVQLGTTWDTWKGRQLLLSLFVSYICVRNSRQAIAKRVFIEKTCGNCEKNMM